MSDRTITLPIGDIVLVLFDEDEHGRFGGGSISTNLKSVCPYCDDKNCDMDCPDYGEHCSDRDMDKQREKEEEGVEFRLFNSAIDGVESFILSQACVGMDVESDRYIASLTACLDGIGNNY